MPSPGKRTPQKAGKGRQSARDRAKGGKDGAPAAGRSLSRSRTTLNKDGQCYYHERFGEKAWRCGDTKKCKDRGKVAAMPITMNFVGGIMDRSAQTNEKGGYECFEASAPLLVLIDEVAEESYLIDTGATRSLMRVPADSTSPII